MRLFPELGCSYGNGTGGTRPVHKVRYLPSRPDRTSSPQGTNEFGFQSGSSMPIPKAPNGSTGIVSSCRMGE